MYKVSGIDAKNRIRFVQLTLSFLHKGSLVTRRTSQLYYGKFSPAATPNHPSGNTVEKHYGSSSLLIYPREAIFKIYCDTCDLRILRDYIVCNTIAYHDKWIVADADMEGLSAAVTTDRINYFVKVPCQINLVECKMRICYSRMPMDCNAAPVNVVSEYSSSSMPALMAWILSARVWYNAHIHGQFM